MLRDYAYELRGPHVQPIESGGHGKEGKDIPLQERHKTQAAVNYFLELFRIYGMQAIPCNESTLGTKLNNIRIDLS